VRPTRSRGWFTRFAKWTARAVGRPLAFILALLVVVVWVVTGPLFGFSDTWQLIINTGTTIVTFLMVFLIQSTQNRDSEAIQVKLDELIRLSEGGHNALLDLEELEDEELDEIKRSYIAIAEEARELLRRGGSDTDVPEISRKRSSRGR
jgi:low affinity Fe/Cu permease